jgi:hypothetical protein
MTLNSMISPASSNLTRSMPPRLPVGDTGGKSRRGAAPVQHFVHPANLPVLSFDERRISNGSTMKNDNDRRERQTRAAKNPRQNRLKLALRENLKRRKSQARGRSDGAVAPSHQDDASPHDGSGKKPGE